MSAALSPAVSVAGDPGGAAALLPVLQGLKAQGSEILAFAYRQALPLFHENGLHPQALPETTNSNFILPENASILLTATSVNGIDWEARSWQSARARGIPSLAVLDYWNNLQSRFVLDGKTVTPDRIAVIDESNRNSMVAAGFPPEMLAITGQPAFDQLGALIAEGTSIRARLRAEHGLPENALLLLFASQPLARLRHQAGFTDHGFDEQDALALLIPALDALATRRQQVIHLCIRPHPRENENELWQCCAAALASQPGNRFLTVTISRQGLAREWALAADLVCGMHTVLLQEACYLERPVLSLQPGLRGEDPLPANRQGISCPITDPAALPAALESMLFDSAIRAAFAERQRQARPPANATENVITLARSLLHGSDSSNE